MTATFDIVIVGGGPAGLSAASSIVRQAHSTLLIDSGEYRNENCPMHTVPTWDHRQPSDFRAAARKDFERYGSVTIENTRATAVKKLDDGLFEITGAAGQVWQGRKLVLATGVKDVFPNIDGYAECWISGIFHCLYCHGWEERGAATSGVIAEGECGRAMIATHLARQALRLSKETTMYTLGDEELTSAIEADIANVPQMKVDSRKVRKLVKALTGSEVTLHFQDGTTKTEGFLAHKPKFELRGDLADQLGLEKQNGVIKVNPPFNQTSVKGIFAAGDAAHPMQTITQAMHSGTACGGGAPLQLQAETYGQKGML
ncbi:hypothetical protein HYFRA_00014111 [Hymenoscyphus fraxineus]|uniref:FAD/NAD(P)-binding domain-containing protein n=1 Tax=Hymenoscyphus fraxineus TaxID=746836 RepID=A0A9N9Q0C3_9HELO|nr:hypothetical protein HYFRA_00014111 [Hymenoscyphus fraxineus]